METSELSQLVKQTEENSEQVEIRGREIAASNNMRLSKFKSEVSSIVDCEDYTEDHWTFDYESYLSFIANGYGSPTDFAKDFYKKDRFKT